MSGSLFITGADGFIGRRLLTRLDTGNFDDVVCLCRDEAQERRLARQFPGPRPVIGDLRARGRYAPALRAETTVVHLAARTSGSPEEMQASNVQGTEALLAACEDRGIRRFLHVSSIAAGYADLSSYAYGASKQAAEAVVQRSNVDWTIVRPTLVLGRESQAWKRIARLAGGSIVWVPGTGKAKTQPIHVDDLVDLLLTVVFERLFQRETYDLGGPEVLTIEEFLVRVHRALGGDAPRLVHLPLPVLRWLLERFERAIPGRFRDQKGRLLKFDEDGVARPNRLLQRALPRLRDIDTILADLVND